MPLTFDQYSFCSLGCMYCFAYFFKSNNPAIQDFTLKSVNSGKITDLIYGKPTTKRDKLWHKYFFSKKFLFHWGGLADPFCSFERKNGVGLKIIKALGQENYPCLFSFKGPVVFDKPYRRQFEKYADQKNFAFQISMVTINPRLAKRVEIGVPSPQKRLRAIRMLSEMGYWTILRLRPFIIGLTDLDLKELLDEALDAGINAVSCEWMAIDGRANVGMKTRYDWVSKLIGVKDLQKHFAKLSPSERGGYMRLNRLVKEESARMIYEFCQDHDLVCAFSDPDYKELNTSGSCCGMPARFPDNPLLENWTRHQLTYHLKEARRKFHKTGKEQLFKFDDVYGDAPYLDDKDLAQDHPGIMRYCCAQRVNLTQRLILQMQWNNLRSPANPRNYFHGKIMPCGVDEKGNLMFRYRTHSYERRWIADGLDLTR